MGDFQGHPFRGNQWTEGSGVGAHGVIAGEVLADRITAAIKEQPSRDKHGEVGVGDTGKTGFVIAEDGKIHVYNDAYSNPDGKLGPRAAEVHAHPDKTPPSGEDVAMYLGKLATGKIGAGVVIQEGSGHTYVLTRGADWSEKHAKAYAGISPRTREGKGLVKWLQGTPKEREAFYAQGKGNAEEFFRDRIRRFVQDNGGLVFIEGLDHRQPSKPPGRVTVGKGAPGWTPARDASRS